MTKRVGAALLGLLAVAGAGRAGEKEIIERLEKAGAFVGRDESGDGDKDALEVKYSPGLDGDPNLPELCELRRLRSLKLSGNRITDAGMGGVGGLTQLRSLGLSGTAVGDAGLKELRGLRNLESLYLSHTGVTDAGLDDLAGLTGLRLLDLNGNGVTDAGIESLARLRGLRRVYLRGTGVTEEGAARLRQALPDCEVYR